MRKFNSMEDFSRDINYRAQVSENETIFLFGTLKDKFHDIRVEVVVDITTLKIVSSRCVINSAPSSFCVKIEERLAMLEGIVVGKGLSRELNKVLGGAEGCGNLRSLLIGLLPLALNVKASLGLTDDKIILDTIHRNLQGACIGYPVLHDEEAGG